MRRRGSDFQEEHLGASDRDRDGDAPPGVSVVIPVRDGARQLARCLRALDRQTVPPDEIIVVDDGSGDGSGAIAERMGARVLRIDEANIPAAAATGYDAATHDIIARVDADSEPPADWVARILDAFAEHPDAAAVTGPGVFANGRLRIPLSALYLGAYRWLCAAALGHAPLFGSNLAVRRSAWHGVRDDVHRHDPLIHDDLDLSFHLGPSRMIVWDPRLRLSIDAPSGAPASVLLRARRGLRTVVIHWPADLPWKRWWRRFQGSRVRASADPRQVRPPLDAR